jgi:hypothetical protein
MTNDCDGYRFMPGHNRRLMDSTIFVGSIGFQPDKAAD